MLRVDGVVGDRGVEPEAVALFAVVEGSLQLAATAATASAPAPAPRPAGPAGAAVLLGLFFLGTFTKRVGQTAAFVGIIAGAALMLYVKLQTGVSWQWYVLIGSVTTFLVGLLTSLFPVASAKSTG